METKMEKSHKTIKSLSLYWLCHIDYYVDRDNPKVKYEEKPEDVAVRSVGLMYTEILAKVKEQFPESGTTIECLRWYAVKARNSDIDFEGYTLPQIRPRSRKVAAPSIA